MKLSPAPTVAELATLLNATYAGPGDMPVTGMNEIHRVAAGDLTFVDVAKYFNKALGSAATTVLINQRIEPPAGKALIFVEEPFTAFNQVGEHYRPRLSVAKLVPDDSQIDPTAQLAPGVVMGTGVSIGPGVEIGPHVTIGNHVRIGEGSLIYPNVYIGDFTRIGRHCVVQAGAVLGGEAFYFKKRPWGREKLLSKGRVVLADYVEIGANTTLDRGVTADTSVGEHTKIDNLVQVGHDTQIGARCIIAAQTGIAGATTIEDDVIIWGQVAVPSGITIGKGAVLQGRTGVLSSLEGGKTYAGTPAQDPRAYWRQLVALRRLPDMMRGQADGEGLS